MEVVLGGLLKIAIHSAAVQCRWMKSLLIGCRLCAIAIFSISPSFSQDHPFPGIYEPDHLVPLDPNPGDWHVRYMNVLGAQLKLNAAFFARMILKPSFDGESCLRLHGNDETEILKSDKFFLTCYEADQNIWYAMPENSSEKSRVW